MNIRNLTAPKLVCGVVTILPATAHYEHNVLKGRWIDLPIASFRESVQISIQVS